MRAKFLTTTNVTYWGAVLGSNEGVYVLLGLCRRNPYNSGREKKGAIGPLCLLLIFMHYARLNHSPVARSAPLVGAARGSAQRPKPCISMINTYEILMPNTDILDAF